MTTSEKIASQVSSFVDSEMDRAEVSLLIKQMSNNPELRQRWQNYYLISDAMKKQVPDEIDLGFAQRVSQALEQEEVLKPRLQGGLKRFSGMAIAASVALVGVLSVVMVAQQPGVGGGAPQVAAQTVSPGSAAPVQQPVPSTMVSTVSVPMVKDPRLNKYLVNHSEYASGASVQRVLPYARIVGQEVRK